MAKRFGAMLDMSRNGVMKPEQVKTFAHTLKTFGYNMLQPIQDVKKALRVFSNRCFG